MGVRRRREGGSNEHSPSLVHRCFSCVGRALEDENIARRPAREHAIADIQRVAEEVLVDDVGDESFAGWPLNRELDVGSLIFNRVDFARGY